MPIPASTMKSICTVCGWSRISPQHSDVLMVPRECPVCGSMQMRHTAASPLEDIEARLKEAATRILKLGKR